MAKVICTLPNASNLISGVKFIEHKLGMISEEVEDDVAQAFVKIEGYVLHSKSAAKEIAAKQASVQTQSDTPDTPQTPATDPAAPAQQ